MDERKYYEKVVRRIRVGENDGVIGVNNKNNKDKNKDKDKDKDKGYQINKNNINELSNNNNSKYDKYNYVDLFIRYTKN